MTNDILTKKKKLEAKIDLLLNEFVEENDFMKFSNRDAKGCHEMKINLEYDYRREMSGFREHKEIFSNIEIIIK